MKATMNSNKMPTTYPLKVQAMRSQGQQPRFYVSFPLALAAAIGLQGGETVQWELLDRGELHLVRPEAPRRPAPAAVRPKTEPPHAHNGVFWATGDNPIGYKAFPPRSNPRLYWLLPVGTSSS